MPTYSYDCIINDETIGIESFESIKEDRKKTLSELISYYKNNNEKVSFFKVNKNKWNIIIDKNNMTFLSKFTKKEQEKILKDYNENDNSFNNFMNYLEEYIKNNGDVKVSVIVTGGIGFILKGFDWPSKKIRNARYQGKHKKHVENLRESRRQRVKDNVSLCDMGLKNSMVDDKVWDSMSSDQKNVSKKYGVHSAGETNDIAKSVKSIN